MAPDGWQSVRRILAVRLDNVGDIIMLEPALRSLRAALPAAAITLLATPAGSQAAPLLSCVDDVLVQSVSWQDISGKWPQDPASEYALVQMLRERGFDAAVIFTSFSQSPYPPAYVCYLAGIPIRLAQSKEFGGALLSRWVKPPADDAHQAERNLHLLEQAGFPILGRHLELAVPDEAQGTADRLLREVGIAAGEPFIVMAPGASAAARRYDASRYAQVAARLRQESGLTVVLVGSPREADLVRSVLDGAGAEPGHAIVSLAGRTTVPELAGVIRRAGLVIANNSGPLHLADAFGRPMVILYSGTDLESQWRPRQAPARLLRRPTACAPCYGFRCPYHLECLDIPPEEVVQHALNLLGVSAPQPIGVN